MIINILEWDTHFFKKRIGRLDIDLTTKIELKKIK